MKVGLKSRFDSHLIHVEIHFSSCKDSESSPLIRWQYYFIIKRHEYLGDFPKEEPRRAEAVGSGCVIYRFYRKSQDVVKVLFLLGYKYFSYVGSDRFVGVFAYAKAFMYLPHTCDFYNDTFQ